MKKIRKLNRNYFHQAFTLLWTFFRLKLSFPIEINGLFRVYIIDRESW